MKNISVNMHYVKTVLRHVKLEMTGPARLLQKSGIPPALLANDCARIGVSQYAALQKNTILALDDIFLGYTRQPVGVASFLADCHWLLSCQSMVQVLRRFCRRYDQHTLGFCPRLEISPDAVRLHLDKLPPDPVTAAFLCEHIFFNLHRLCCWLSGQQIALHALVLTYPRPDHADEYRQMFPQCQVSFAASECYMSFASGLLTIQPSQTQAGLMRLLRQPILEFLTNRHHDNSWSYRTRELLRKQAGDMPNLSEVAAQLQVSSKVLRQRLNQEGVTYMDIKNQLRLDLAIYYLSQQRWSIEDIAIKTGYSEASALIRSFKQWTGVTPPSLPERPELSCQLNACYM